MGLLVVSASTPLSSELSSELLLTGFLTGDFLSIGLMATFFTGSSSLEESDSLLDCFGLEIACLVWATGLLYTVATSISLSLLSEDSVGLLTDLIMGDGCVSDFFGVSVFDICLSFCLNILSSNKSSSLELSELSSLVTVGLTVFCIGLVSCLVAGVLSESLLEVESDFPAVLVSTFSPFLVVCFVSESSLDSGTICGVLGFFFVVSVACLGLVGDFLAAAPPFKTGLTLVSDFFVLGVAGFLLAGSFFVADVLSDSRSNPFILAILFRRFFLSSSSTIWSTNSSVDTPVCKTLVNTTRIYEYRLRCTRFKSPSPY